MTADADEQPRSVSQLVVQRGALATIDLGAPRLMLVTDEHVAVALDRFAPATWRGPSGWRAVPHQVLPPGEASKSWDGLGRLLTALDQAGLDRDGHLLAVGGGVVTDLAGMAASLHRRGTAWTAVPTSLVGQVDAAIGGKTAVNLGGGKNTVGTFHPPESVIVDPLALATLAPRHVSAGFAEVLKTALIAGPDAFDDALALTPADLTGATDRGVAAIERCIATKDALVAQDLRDQGPRRLLNLGHTFGHAFEALAMPALLHGEAVGLGLLCAARIVSRRSDATPELERQVRDALQRWDLPTTISADADAVLSELRRDKKRRQGSLRLVLPLAPGRVVIEPAPAPEELRRALLAVSPA